MAETAQHTAPNTAGRRDRLRTRVREQGLEAALVTRLVNVCYLTGFTGSNAALLVTVQGPDTFCTDGRYTTQSASQVPDLDRVMGRNCPTTLAAHAAGRGLRRIGYESHEVSVDGHAALLEASGGADLVSLGQAVERLRAIKDDGEIELIRRACATADRALADLIAAGGLRVGRSERDIGRDLDSRMLELGADAISFETIVASGPNSAIPHHRPTGRELHRGDLLKLDFGAECGGYHSDMTRTMVLGEPAGWQRDLHQLVAEAARLGRQALAPGAEVVAVDRASRDHIAAAGYAEEFGHGLGHGVGLEIHEAPTLSPLGTGTLAEMMPVTVEPGVYLAGRGGVRIEDTLVVRADGPEPLTATTRDLVVL
ncbi:MAG TPA: Xaa-Pro peptidase family protein [Mycobacteriales bacterium]|nr:Xaa-Pro peptidase family protein [Mycobacteriales bacterium]